MRTNGSHFSGSASSGKIASTGHSGSQAPQSMHSSGSMTRMRSASWMQSTGHTSTQDLSLMSMHGSPMMYVIAASLVGGRTLPPALRDELLHDLRSPLGEGGADDDTVEPGRLRRPKSGRVRVVRIAEDRDLRIRLGDLLRVDPRNVDDHEVGGIDAVGRHDPVARAQERVELPTK